MKINLKLFEFQNLLYVLNNSKFTNTEIARVMFKEYRSQETDFISAHQAIISKYEKPTKPSKDEEGKPQPTVTIPDEDQEAMQAELDAFEHEFEISPLTFPVWKKVVTDFPNVIGGLQGEGMINMYENLKAKFTS